MTDISRRAILRGVTLVGAASVGGAAGVGTHALLADEEVFASNSVASGSLDLQVATRTEADGDTSHAPEQDGTFPSTFAGESTVTVVFPDVEPGDGAASGSATVALRACDNPAWVWLRTDGEHSDLADAVEVSVSYADDCGGDGSSLYGGTLSQFLEDFEGGVRLATGCTELGKVELEGGTFTVDGSGDSLDVEDVPGTLVVESDDDDVEIAIEAVHTKDDDGDAEVIGVDVAPEDVSLCRVDVKGGGQQQTPGNGSGGGNGGGSGGNGNGSGNGDNGNGDGGADPSDGVETYWLDCAAAAADLLAGDTPSGNQSGLSHFTLYACRDETCVGCEPECLTLDWSLPDPESVAGESMSFDLDLHAIQCRHTEATNPWQ